MLFLFAVGFAAIAAAAPFVVDVMSNCAIFEMDYIKMVEKCQFDMLTIDFYFIWMLGLWSFLEFRINENFEINF